jgi:SAM-dependent methyltransferase
MMDIRIAPIDTGELLNPNKRFPCFFSRISIIKMLAHGRIINLGCHENNVFGNNNDYEVTNVDLYPFGAKNLTIANIETLPFKDKEFSCAVISEVLEHVDHPDKALREAMRVAHDVIITTPNEYEFDASMLPFKNLVDKKPGYGPDTSGDHVRYFNQEALYDLFKEVNFPLLYFWKMNYGGWSTFIAFGSDRSYVELCHRMDEGQKVGLTHCEVIALIPADYKGDKP